MAFNSKKIFPIDLQPRKALGVKLPFSGKAVFESTFQTKDAIRNNLINYFLTNPGERPLNPSFGGGLRNFIFEQISSGNMQGLKSRIQKDLERFFPLVNILNLNVKGREDSNTINVNLNYSINNTNISDDLTLNFI